MSFSTDATRTAHGRQSSTEHVPRGDTPVYSPARFWPLDPNVSLPPRRHPERRPHVHSPDRDFGMDTLSISSPRSGYFGGATSTLRPEFRGMVSPSQRELGGSPVFDSVLFARRRARRGSNASLDSLRLYGRETGGFVPRRPNMRRVSDASIDAPYTVGYDARGPGRRYDSNGPISSSSMTAANFAHGQISLSHGSGFGIGPTYTPDLETFPWGSSRGSTHSDYRHRLTMGSASQVSATDNGFGVREQSELISLYGRLSMIAVRLGDLASDAMVATGVELSALQMHIDDMQDDIQQIGSEIRRARGSF